MSGLSLVVGLVLISSAACSLFEAVLYSVPASRIEMLEREGRASGRLLKAVSYTHLKLPTPPYV